MKFCGIIMMRIEIEETSVPESAQLRTAPRPAVLEKDLPPVSRVAVAARDASAGEEEPPARWWMTSGGRNFSRHGTGPRPLLALPGLEDMTTTAAAEAEGDNDGDDGDEKGPVLEIPALQMPLRCASRRTCGWHERPTSAMTTVRPPAPTLGGEDGMPMTVEVASHDNDTTPTTTNSTCISVQLVPVKKKTKPKASHNFLRPGGKLVLTSAAGYRLEVERSKLGMRVLMRALWVYLVRLKRMHDHSWDIDLEDHPGND